MQIEAVGATWNAAEEQRKPENGPRGPAESAAAQNPSRRPAPEVCQQRPEARARKSRHQGGRIVSAATRLVLSGHARRSGMTSAPGSGPGFLRGLRTCQRFRGDGDIPVLSPGSQELPRPTGGTCTGPLFIVLLPTLASEHASPVTHSLSALSALTPPMPPGPPQASRR